MEQIKKNTTWIVDIPFIVDNQWVLILLLCVILQDEISYYLPPSLHQEVQGVISYYLPP